MVRTTVYLHEDDLAALRRLATRTGRSQAEIIREAVSRAAREAGPREFHFFGAGQGTGERVAEHADEIAREEMGRSPR